MKRALAELRSRDTAHFGAKAANLGELVGMGLSVPAGFVIRADPHARVRVRSNASLSPGGLTNTSIQRQLFEAFDALGGDLVAVRSSATVEDSVDASYAGLFRTVLNVQRDGLLDAYRQCLASVYEARVRAYRQSRGLQLADIEMPIIIQRMLCPEFSGVCFTEHPVTRATGESLIELARGVGEAVVSGRVTPDSYLFDQQIGRITSAVPGKMDDVPATERGQDLLSRERRELVSRVAHGCAAVHRHFGRAQDIEFAIEKNILYFLQARPLTAKHLDATPEAK